MARKKTIKKQDVALDKADTIDVEVLETVLMDAEKVMDVDLGHAASKASRLKSQSNLILMFLGGLCAGAIGFGVAILPDYLNSDDRLSSLLLDQKATHDQIMSLSETVFKMKNIGSSTNFLEELDPLRISLSKLSSDVMVHRSTQEQEIIALTERIHLLENRPLNGEVPASVIQSYERDITQLRAEIVAVTTQTIPQENKASSALIGIEAAISNGTGYSVLLAELQAVLEQNLPQALSANAQLGVVSLNKLQDEFPKLARVSLHAARGEGGGAGFGAFLKAQLGIRSLSPREGASPDAVLSRAEAAVVVGNLQLALDELIDLPKSGQLALQDWSAQVTARLSVLNALSEVSRIMAVN